MKDFGETLTKYIDHRGWSRGYVSENTKIPRNTLWAWENEKRVPPEYVQDWFFFKMDSLGLPKRE